MLSVRKACLVAGLAGIILGVTTAPALSHHSFAMYDQSAARTLVGKLTRFIPGTNHAQLIFVVLEADGTPVMKDGKPLQWGVETGSAAQLARQGITVESFPTGTIFSVNLYPLRDGRTFGALAGAIVKCGAVMPTGGCTKETGQLLTPEIN